MAKKENVQKVNLNIAPIIDAIECLQNIANNKHNQEMLFQLGDIMKQAIDGNAPIYTTGIGKPGYVAEKFAATLKSVMVNAQFIDATLAGHGDLGPVPEKSTSVLIALSKSGGSDELYKLFRVLKKLRHECFIIMVCMSTDEQFDKVEACGDIDFKCRFIVDPKELEGYGIVPTTSNALYEMILATALINAFPDKAGAKNLCERLKKSHPSGTLYNKTCKLIEKLNSEEEPADSSE